MAKIKDSEESKDNLGKLLDSLNKKYGKGTLINGKDLPDSYKVISTGSLTLDLATTIQGNPIGKLIEMHGFESSGKSTLTLHFISEFQKAGHKCMLVDSEQSFDKQYAESIGVKTDELIYTQPECLEDAWNIMEAVIKSKEVGLIVFDSHTSCVPKKIIDGEVGDATMALQARVNSVALAKIHRLLGPNEVTLVCVSQLRQNIGGYGDPNVVTGGLGWKFYSDIRYKVSKSVDKMNDQNKTTVEVIKNKCGAPFGKAEFMIKWGYGIDRQQELIDLAVEHKFITLGGAGWYTVAEDVKVQGDNKLKAYLDDNPEFAQELERKVMNAISPKFDVENVA